MRKSVINTPAKTLTPMIKVAVISDYVEPSTRIKDLERALFLAKQENDDLRITLKINKESL